jgi:hypothetical protein
LHIVSFHVITASILYVFLSYVNRIKYVILIARFVCSIKNGQTRETSNIVYRGHRTKTKKTECSMKNGQTRETSNIVYRRHRTKTKKTECTMKNGQTRETSNIVYRRHRTKTKTKNKKTQRWKLKRWATRNLPGNISHV